MSRFLLNNNKKLMIGYDLANTCSQISYCYKKESEDVETVGTVEGEENFDIPTVLCKRIGTNQWLFGHDAVRFCRERREEGILVENLLELALSGEPVQIDGKEYHPAALLALFIRRSLGTVVPANEGDRIDSIMFTCERVDEKMEALIRRVEKTLDLRNAEIFCQCYEESFFSYMMSRPQSLWDAGVLLLDYRSNPLNALQMECNSNTVPKVMYSVGSRFSFGGTDRELLDIGQQLCDGRQISSVYLIGEKFREEWMEESLRYLCTGRRVFQGNNLYSKGACYSLRDRQQEENREYIFLGPDKWKSNVGMKVYKRGESVYNALLDAGMNWKTLEESFECYLKGENYLELLITPLTKGSGKRVFMELEGLGLEPSGVTRIRIKLQCLQENLLQITVCDLGFGEFRQATDRQWVKEVEV